MGLRLAVGVTASFIKTFGFYKSKFTVRFDVGLFILSSVCVGLARSSLKVVVSCKLNLLGEFSNH